jgi:methylenetetrahydrofolate dehydrogenase (NADP+)/methenyltetrahydrofolate cyclohydrolase
VLIGNNPSSTVYVKHKQQACAKVGISSNVVHLSETITNEQVAEVITDLANDDVTDGILMQMPLPRQLDERDLCNRIPQHKDVDGLNAASIGKINVIMKWFINCQRQSRLWIGAIHPTNGPSSVSCVDT